MSANGGMASSSGDPRLVASEAREGPGTELSPLFGRKQLLFRTASERGRLKERRSFLRRHNTPRCFLSRPRINETSVFVSPENDLPPEPAFTKLIRWLIGAMRVFGLHPSATPAVSKTGQPIDDPDSLSKTNDKESWRCCGVGWMSGVGLGMWVLAMAANVYGGVLFWSALVKAVQETDIFSPSAAWQLLCTILHGMATMNLLFALVHARGIHVLLLHLNALRLRRRSRPGALVWTLLLGSFALATLSLGFIVALIFTQPEQPDALPTPAGTTESPTDAAGATPAPGPSVVSGGTGFLWLLFQMWLALTIFLGNLLPAGQYAAICAYVKEAFRQNHADFLLLHSPSLHDVRHIKGEFFRLTRILAKANAVFAYKVIFNVGASVGGFCFAVYHLVKAGPLGAEEYGGAAMQTRVQGLVGAIVLAQTAIFAAYMMGSACANEESRAIKDSLLEQECDDAAMKFCIDRFIQKCETREWGLSVAKFFLIDRAAFLTAVSVIFTFLVVWVQLSHTSVAADLDSPVGFACNCHCPNSPGQPHGPKPLFNHSQLLPFGVDKRL